MEKEIKMIRVFKDEQPKIVNPIKEEITDDSNLELNPAIKNTNFFDDPEVVDFLLDHTK